MKLFLLLLIFFQFSYFQNNNEIKTFYNILEDQKSLYKLLNNTKKFKQFFNLNSSEKDDENEYLEEEDLEKSYDTIIDDYTQRNINNNEIHLLDITNFTKYNQNLKFFILLKFVGINPSKKIFFLIKVIYKDYNETSNNGKQEKEVNCDFFELNNSDFTSKYNCSFKLNGEVEFIESYYNFSFDGIKYELLNENENRQESCDFHKKYENKIFYNENNHFYIKGKLKDLEKNDYKLNFKMKQKYNNENFETNVECYFIEYKENDDYILRCNSEKNLKRKINDGNNININEIKKDKDKTHGFTKIKIVIISFTFVALFIFLLIFAIMLRRQITEVIISVKVQIQ